MIDPGLWDELRGMDEPKEIIERRVILPLAEPELARRHGVVQPKAIILFGPPGTGKTTFAKGIASRLGWPFFEVSPSEIGAEGAERQAKLLAETFDELLEVPAAVVFVDEVEDLASIRSDERRVSPSVTNEFLKQIPRMREAPHHLLACATNWVSRLDPAFLRPGRFDYVLPVGPPDAEAREMIWQRYIGEITDEPVDVGELVSASNLFTPADVEWSARTAAQHGVRAGALRRGRPACDDRRLPGGDPERQADADAGDDRRVPRRDRAVQARLTRRRHSACLRPASITRSAITQSAPQPTMVECRCPCTRVILDLLKPRGSLARGVRPSTGREAVARRTRPRRRGRASARDRPGQPVGKAPKVNGRRLFPLDKFGHDHLWWLDRMVRTSRPLTERMTLVWHDWFATSNETVGSQRLMIRQNNMFRRSGLGSFPGLVTRVTENPAMLLYLNGLESEKGAPNENYARELMELFTLGHGSGYTERDVREQARALTGFTATYKNGYGWVKFRFDRNRHDDAMKVVFDKPGPYGWKQAVMLTVSHPAHKTFFTRKLWSYFIPEPADDETQAELEDFYVQSGYSTRSVLSAILKHPRLYEGPRMVKPPAVYLAGMRRILGDRISTEDYVWLSIQAGQLSSTRRTSRAGTTTAGSTPRHSMRAGTLPSGCCASTRTARTTRRGHGAVRPGEARRPGRLVLGSRSLTAPARRSSATPPR